ncbi:VCBS repeat-containing protein [Flavobacterium gawalongense]|uniref:CRTAC1 family protein n=1 Tax=Flavobacterium gawalongense TaxID=2594432 RepID=A0A553BXJ0_9FLAO|nr:VCBS repeat-containing protein [Flavobacterium gawalongense]TRX04210.1 CRTAC1 family protein [Flavobacterium gawalongense]TRX09340.1 CRTAC1 family protein [Flavobacterium gawalongense]TRX12846.1 CRTAC1 family protein [Flavobacterium gawalongense]TRX13191.1 CRTAC1 family protein [Flavobacterium gawalongense]TRX30747.1 CRTAC1 family protein [Flavobacterium gawalongense]
MFNRIILFFPFLLFFTNCSKENLENKDSLFSKLDASQTGINFVNEVKNGVDMNVFKYRNFYNGGGVAIGDINNDGLSDVYFTSNLGTNKLYLNKGNFKFQDISKKAGIEGTKSWSTGVVMVDINADGLLDIYVCNAGNSKGDQQKNELFINNGNDTFTEKADEYNLADTGITTHAAFFDYDKDGDLDCYILNNSFIPVSSLNYSNKRDLRDKDWDVADILKGGGDKLLRNDNGKFVDVSAASGIYGSLIGFGLGVTVGDVNGDLYPDIYISNDFYERDYLYINNKNGTFTEQIQGWTSHISQSSMGADMADINNDGKADIFVTDMLPEHDERLKTTTNFENYDLYLRKINLDFFNQYMQNTLQLNNGNNQFLEIANHAGVSKTDWSWGALLFDMDNDGYKDIYVCNGIYHDLTNQDFVDFFANEFMQKMVVTGKKEEIETIINKMPSTAIPNYAFKNNKNLTFTNEAQKWGLDTPSFSNGAAYGDLDNDGDLDLIVNNVNMEAFVYQNNSEKNKNNHFVKVKLKGDNQNKFGVGSIVELFSDNEIIRQELIPSRGFQSSIDYVMTFGIGTKKIDSLHVIWPNDKFQTLKKIANNCTINLNIADAKLNYVPKKDISKPLFSEKKTSFLAHKENDYIDFDYEGLISKMLSQEGPSLAVADINGDGNEDVFIGGAKGQAGKIYLNKGNGNYSVTDQKDLDADANFEDTAASFFDADNDGDQDLLVGSGGNEKSDQANYKNRLYLNNGKGVFVKSKTNMPTTNNNVSVIAPNDFDNDGDIDVFIGSRSVPGVYGIDPKHLLLENDGKGNFTNVTDKKAFKINSVGMITDAVWEDIDNDSKKDLILVGDWTAPMIFKNTGRRLTEFKSNLTDYHGFWNTVSCVDLNNDGKKDLVLGNKGTNTSYKATNANPMKLFTNDFDNNGTIEQIATRSIDGKDLPINLKQELAKQIPSIKKKNLSYADYSKKTFQELFAKEVVENSIQKTVNIQESVIAINKGNGKFEIKLLPKEVQFSCVNTICTMDVNNDGILDLILGGNQYEFKPQFSRLDANYGSVLLGNKKGAFSWTPYNKSGFFIKGEVKQLKTIKDKNKTVSIIAVVNDNTTKIFKRNE